MDRLRRNTEVRLCTVDVVPPEFETFLIPAHPPGVPRVVHHPGNRLPFPGFPIGCRVDRGTRSPFAVAVPLEEVDLAVRLRILVDGPERRPQAGVQTVEFDPRFPGGVDRAPPVAAQLACEVLVTLAGGLQDQVGISVEENVPSAVDPVYRREDVVLPGLGRPFREVGALAGRSVEFVVEDVSTGRAGGRGRCSRGQMGEPKPPGAASRPPAPPAPSSS